MVCGGFSETAKSGEVLVWAQCWFFILIFIVIVTLLILMIFGLISLANIRNMLRYR